MQQKIESTWSASSIHFSFRSPFFQQKFSISLLIPSEQLTMAFILLMGDLVLASYRICSMQQRQGCSMVLVCVNCFRSSDSMSAASGELVLILWMQDSMVLQFRQNLSFTRKRSGELSSSCFSTSTKEASWVAQQWLTAEKTCPQKLGSLKRTAVQALRIFSQLARKRFGCSSPKLPKPQQSTTASRSTTRNCLISSVKSPMRTLAAYGSRQVFSMYNTNRRLTLPSMQPTSPKCLSSSIENFRNTSRSCADCCVTSLSAPITDEIVSSSSEITDLRKLPLEATLMALGDSGGLPLPSRFIQALRSMFIRAQLGRASIMLAM